MSDCGLTDVPVTGKIINTCSPTLELRRQYERVKTQDQDKHHGIGHCLIVQTNYTQQLRIQVGPCRQVRTSLRVTVTRPDKELSLCP